MFNLTGYVLSFGSLYHEEPLGQCTSAYLQLEDEITKTSQSGLNLGLVATGQSSGDYKPDTSVSTQPRDISAPQSGMLNRTESVTGYDGHQANFLKERALKQRLAFVEKRLATFRHREQSDGRNGGPQQVENLMEGKGKSAVVLLHCTRIVQIPLDDLPDDA